MKRSDCPCKGATETLQAGQRGQSEAIPVILMLDTTNGQRRVLQSVDALNDPTMLRALNQAFFSPRRVEAK